MDFQVLGRLEVSLDGAPVRIGSRMQRRLLALLLLHAGDPVPAERMVDLLWDGEPPPSAPQGLHTYVSRLRRALGDGAPIESDAHGYRLRVEDDRLDVRRFERLVATARERSTDAPAQAAADLAEALALWRGPAYAEIADSPVARPEAVRLDELRLAATEDLFAARLAVDDAGLVADLEAFATANPLRERPHAQLMTALSRAGRQTEALEVFQRLRHRLADEAGLDPSPALQQLQEDILRQASEVTAGGQLPAEERAGRAGQDPVASLPGNLPRPVTSFLGRRHETEAVCRLLERGRLVTLTGVGGVGKTRLALRTASTVAEEYPDGAWWCELAPADPEAVGHTVADALRVQQQSGRSAEEAIVDALADKRLLLVLDNCEHVVRASAQVAEHIVRRCPDVTILVTSRQPLAVDGEQVWAVPPLPLPSDRAGDRSAAPAAQLFEDRATAHLADFTVDEPTSLAIADICRQLDGLPLAIELAAALVPTLEPAEIARRLGHRFRLLTHGPHHDPRHRSLAAVVDWSYQLLEPDEQRLFDRLAVFTGGFTLGAAEGICADRDLPAERIAGLLAGLVSRSMVGVDRGSEPTRYHLLETLRQYAEQQLTERGEQPALRARHADWFVDLAERTDVDVRGRDEAEAVDRLEAELANLRAAHRWAVEHDDADLALRLAAALHVYARFRLRDEVFAWAHQAAGLPSATGHRLRPMVCGVAAHGVSNRGELARARDLAEQAIAAASESYGLFVPLRVLASTALYEGRLEDCRRRTDEAMEAARRDGDTYYLNWMQMHRVLTLVYGGQREEGLEAAVAQRKVAEQVGNPSQRAWTRYGHAEACGDADPETALELLEEVIELAEPVRAHFLVGVARVAITSLLARHRSPREALASFPGLIGHWRRLGDWTHQWTTLRNLVPLLVRLGADEPAALLSGALRTADTGGPAFGDDAVRIAEADQTLTARLGPDAFHALAERGGAMSGEEAISLARRSISEILDGTTSPPSERTPPSRPTDAATGVARPAG